MSPSLQRAKQILVLKGSSLTQKCPIVTLFHPTVITTARTDFHYNYFSQVQQCYKQADGREPFAKIPYSWFATVKVILADVPVKEGHWNLDKQALLYGLHKKEEKGAMRNTQSLWCWKICKSIKLKMCPFPKCTAKLPAGYHACFGKIHQAEEVAAACRRGGLDRPSWKACPGGRDPAPQIITLLFICLRHEIILAAPTTPRLIYFNICRKHVWDPTNNSLFEYCAMTSQVSSVLHVEWGKDHANRQICNHVISSSVKNTDTKDLSSGKKNWSLKERKKPWASRAWCDTQWKNKHSILNRPPFSMTTQNSFLFIFWISLVLKLHYFVSTGLIVRHCFRHQQ